MSEQYLLEMIDIEKQFPGVKALDHAQLKLRAGTVHALMGENGRGQVHADEVPVWHLHARRRRSPDGR